MMGGVQKRKMLNDERKGEGGGAKSGVLKEERGRRIGHLTPLHRNFTGSLRKTAKS